MRSYYIRSKRLYSALMEYCHEQGIRVNAYVTGRTMLVYVWGSANAFAMLENEFSELC